MSAAGWAVTLQAEDRARLDALASARDQARSTVLDEAVAVGLRALADGRPGDTASPPIEPSTSTSSPKVTEAGALAVLVGPRLAARLGWRLDADRPPDPAFEAAAGRLALSTGERTIVAVALGLWNGARHGVDVAALAGLDSTTGARLGRALAASDLPRWAAAELATLTPNGA